MNLFRHRTLFWEKDLMTCLDRSTAKSLAVALLAVWAKQLTGRVTRSTGHSCTGKAGHPTLHSWVGRPFSVCGLHRRNGAERSNSLEEIESIFPAVFMSAWLCTRDLCSEYGLHCRNEIISRRIRGAERFLMHQSSVLYVWVPSFSHLTYLPGHLRITPNVFGRTLIS